MLDCAANALLHSRSQPLEESDVWAALLCLELPVVCFQFICFMVVLPFHVSRTLSSETTDSCFPQSSPYSTPLFLFCHQPEEKGAFMSTYYRYIVLRHKFTEVLPELPRSHSSVHLGIPWKVGWNIEVCCGKCFLVWSHCWRVWMFALCVAVQALHPRLHGSFWNGWHHPLRSKALWAGDCH